MQCSDTLSSGYLLAVALVVVAVIADEKHFFDMLQRECCLAHGLDGDLCGLVFGVTKNPCADVGKCHGAHLMLICEEEAVAVAIGQEVWLGTHAALPHGAYGVDDPLAGQVACGGDDGFTGAAAAAPVAYVCTLFENLRTAGPVNGTIHAATAHEAVSGCVDDGIYFYLGDISFDDFQLHGYPFLTIR